MRRLLIGVPFAFMLLVGSSASARAQDQTLTIAAYVAFTTSPPGTFAPYLPRSVFSAEREERSIHARYGNIKSGDEEDKAWHSVGVTYEFPLGLSRGGVTVGFQTGVQNTSYAMLGAEWQTVFSRGSLGTGGPGSPVLMMVLRPEVGVGFPVSGDESGYVFSSGLSMPMLIPIGSDIQFVPFISPGLGVGLVSSEGTYTSEVRTMAGGGLVVHNEGRLDLTLGFHKVFIDGGHTTIGLGLTWHR